MKRILSGEGVNDKFKGLEAEEDEVFEDDGA